MPAPERDRHSNELPDAGHERGVGRSRSRKAEPVDQVPRPEPGPLQDGEDRNRKDELGEEGGVARPVVPRCALDVFMREI